MKRQWSVVKKEDESPPTLQREPEEDRTVGYRYTFLQDPPSHCICRICKLVSRDPHQAACCKSIFCSPCLKNYYKSTSSPTECPQCKNTLKEFRDMKTNNEIMNLRVYCRKREEGCMWDGKLEELLRHFAACSCRTVVCKSCDAVMLRKYLSEHKKMSCPYRKYICPNCHTEGKYLYIIGSHLTECPEALVQCENKDCSEKVKRSNMAAHQAHCNKEIVSCLFSSIGCPALVRREELEKHDQTNIHQHLVLAMQRIKSLEATIANHKDVILRHEATIQKLSLQSQAVIMKCSGYTALKEASQSWRSPGFYSNPGGYKMCLEVHPNGYGNSDNHISCFIRLLPGDFDGRLEWPFQGEVKIELLNQVEDARHHNNVITFGDITPMPCKMRVEEGFQYGKGWGNPKFISHNDLEVTPNHNCQYLSDDMLCFRVSSTIKCDCKPWLIENIKN